MEADHLPFGSTFPARIALATAYLQSIDLRRAEETLLDASQVQSGTPGDPAVERWSQCKSSILAAGT